MQTTASSLNLVDTPPVRSDFQTGQIGHPKSFFSHPVLLLAISLTATGLLAFLLQRGTQPSSWLHNFLFDRTFIQWVIVWMMFHGLVEIVARAGTWLRERQGVRVWRAGQVPSRSSGLVCERYDRVGQLLACASVTDLRAGVKSLAERAVQELDARYSTINVLVHLASYCGFLGTVYGLSKGLYQAFNSQQGISMKLFGGSVATSFDATLIGLLCTILLIMLQSVLRTREDAVLADVDALVEDALLSHEQTLARTLGLDGSLPSAGNMASLLGAGLDKLQAEVRGIGGSVDQLAAVVGQVLGGVERTMNSLEGTSAAIRTLSAEVHREFSESRSAMQRVEAESKGLSSQCAVMSSRVSELKAAVDRPRRVQVVEVA